MISIEFEENMVYVLRDGECVWKGYRLYISNSDTHMSILSEATTSEDTCSILISYLTEFVCFSIPYGECYLTWIYPLEDVEVGSCEYDSREISDLMEKIKDDAQESCENIADGSGWTTLEILEEFDKSEYLIDDYKFDVSISHMNQHLDTSRSAMGYGLLLHLYKKYGPLAIEYLSVL